MKSNFKKSYVIYGCYKWDNLYQKLNNVLSVVKKKLYLKHPQKLLLVFICVKISSLNLIFFYLVKKFVQFKRD